MTHEVPKQEWKDFFDDLSKRRFEWETKVEVIKESIGDQILAQGLSLNGITAEDRDDETVVEIIVGHDTGHHQTHNIINPTKVRYLADEDKPSGSVEIEEMDGTKTLVYIIQPQPIVLKFVETKGISAI